MSRLVTLVPLCAALGACYEAPGALDRARVLTLERISSEALVADGNDLVEFEVKIDPLTPTSSIVTIQTSSGMLAPDTNPSAESARKIERKNAGDGVIPFELRVGNEPGETILSARIGEFEDSLVLTLNPSEVTQLELDTESAQVTADGAAKVSLTVSLFAADTKKSVSVGARVEMIACCAGANGLPQACDTSELVSFPKLVALTQGQEMTVDVVPRRLTGADPTRLWIVAQAQKEGRSPPSCEAAEETPVLKRLLITLNPTQ